MSYSSKKTRERLHIHLDTELKEIIDRNARRMNLNRSDYLNKTLRKYYQQKEMGNGINLVPVGVS